MLQVGSRVPFLLIFPNLASTAWDWGTSVPRRSQNVHVLKSHQRQSCSDWFPIFCGCQKITGIYFEIMLPAFLFYINIISIYCRELRKYRRVYGRNLNGLCLCHPESTRVSISARFLSGFTCMSLFAGDDSADSRLACLSVSQCCVMSSAAPSVVAP